MDRIAVLSGHFQHNKQSDHNAVISDPSLHSNPTSSSHSGITLMYSPEVKDALRLGKPVVALESTIVSHGMPYPQNLQTAHEVEDVVRSNGAIPATIAILEGIPHIGLTASQLERIARGGAAVRKTSRRDLPAVIALRQDGATTVSATMLLASRAGISIFVTGGIGGVHRGAETTMDISADLTELGRTPVTVICAGAKSVLDIPRTLEYLETQGVGVAAYGVDEFPAFFTRHSGCRAPTRFDSPGQIAAATYASEKLKLDSGMVIGVPIPEEYAAAGAEVEKAIETALNEAGEKNIQGNEVTPFLLQRIRELTGGKSLTANIHLVKNNAAVGARIAVELGRLKRE
jgi:pseudouridine-5'-phosphate glycosidase